MLRPVAPLHANKYITAWHEVAIKAFQTYTDRYRTRRVRGILLNLPASDKRFLVKQAQKLSQCEGARFQTASHR